MLVRQTYVCLCLGALGPVLALACGQAPLAGEGSSAPSAPSAPGAAAPTLVGGASAPDASPSGALPGATSCTSPPVPSSPFTGALCACNDVNVQGFLQTRAFSSLSGPPDAGPNPGGGAVGVNHDYVIGPAGANAGFTDVGGSFTVAGGATGFAGFLSVVGDLRAAGAVDVAGYSLVTRDAWMGGDFHNTGFAQVGRDLHIQGQDWLPAVVGGVRAVGPVSVAEPCACAPSQIIDVGSLVTAAASSNDDATVGLGPEDWSALVGDAQTTLPAGRYYVDAIGGVGNLVLHAAGKVSVFVGGDVILTGRIAVILDPTAEVDLFIAGALQLTGYSSLGDASRPSATRIYSATSGDIDLTGFEPFVGNLYAPAARVTSRGFVEVRGSLFVRDFLVAGYASFVYDIAVAGGTGGCPPSSASPPGGPASPPGGSCTAFSCSTGQACVGGVCGPCEVDSDCSGQLSCNAGVCGPLLQ